MSKSESDNLGQLKSGKRYWEDGSPVPGQQHEYTFDDIGNRSATKAGGDENGANLRSATYAANNLNQYTNRTVPGAVDILGAAHPQATVTVNSQGSPYRRGEYFRKELSVNNSAGLVWQGVTNAAVLSGQTNITTGYVFLPKATETYFHDADGNLTSDGRWTNRWDGENRLIHMVTLSSVPDGAKQALVFLYDAQGRRVAKTVSNWVGSAWSRVSDQRFLYDTWNLLAELDVMQNPNAPAPQRSYLWGLDLSGSMQGAGGVGGLLAVTDYWDDGLRFASYDGNGNVTMLVNGSSGTPSANPFRFSTKYHDDGPGMVYYGYRFYNPNTGQWLSRDPLGEKASRNVLAFLNNSPCHNIDFLGLLLGRACQWNIYSGHDTYCLEAIKYRVPNMPPGDKIACLSCGQSYLHNLVLHFAPGSVISTVPNIDDLSMEGRPSANDYLSILTKVTSLLGYLGMNESGTAAFLAANPLDTYSINSGLDLDTLQETWNNSIAKAKAHCSKNVNCCKSIAISMHCETTRPRGQQYSAEEWELMQLIDRHGYFHTMSFFPNRDEWEAWAFPVLRNAFPDQRICGRSITINCGGGQ